MTTALRFLTSGESHGKGLTGIIEGIPSGLPLSSEDIAVELKRRQSGYGRGGRMKIEQDRAEIISGVRWGKTIGSPIALFIENRDWKNWDKAMSPDIMNADSIDAVTRPRPGHADLAGSLKYNQKDIRNILERSSARETAMRVALGAVAKKFLVSFGICVGSYVTRIGGISCCIEALKLGQDDLADVFDKAEASQVRCPETDASLKMMKCIDKATENGDTLGGIFEVFANGLPIGLGSHTQWDKRLDGRLSQAIMSIQAIKGVEVGLGFGMAEKPGSEVMDEIFYGADTVNAVNEKGFYRETNFAGGIEGGMTNGMPLVLRAVMKPIPTLRQALRSVDIISKKPLEAAYERSDTCAVPAAAVVAEAMTALILADAFLEKFGGDGMDGVKRALEEYEEHIRNF